MRAENRIRPNDTMGFQMRMRELLEGDDEALAMVDAFVRKHFELDQWRLQNERAKEFQPCEPCFNRDFPAIVVAVCQVRVSVRWFRPLKSGALPASSLAGKVSQVDPKNLIKVSTQAKWDRWNQHMKQCGHNPDGWSRANFLQVAPPS